MTITVVDHQIEGKCLLDTETFEYYLLPYLNNKITFNSKLFNYAETIEDFINGDEIQSVIPVFCADVKKDKRRFFASIITGNDIINIYNVEKINDRWAHNAIDIMEKLNVYFIFCKKDKSFDNGFMILRAKLIERR